MSYLKQYPSFKIAAPICSRRAQISCERKIRCTNWSAKFQLYNSVYINFTRIVRNGSVLYCAILHTGFKEMAKFFLIMSAITARSFQEHVEWKRCDWWSVKNMSVHSLWIRCQSFIYKLSMFLSLNEHSTKIYARHGILENISKFKSERQLTIIIDQDIDILIIYRKNTSKFGCLLS